MNKDDLLVPCELRPPDLVDIQPLEISVFYFKSGHNALIHKKKKKSYNTSVSAL